MTRAQWMPTSCSTSGRGASTAMNDDRQEESCDEQIRYSL